ECVIWPLSCDNHGYPCGGYNGQKLKSHRWICEATHGPAPEGKPHAAHSCGRTNCVNPKHLRWASPKENMADSVRLGTIRSAGPGRRRKLTEADVARIMSLKGTASYDKIGAMFGVKGKQIGKIYRGEQWIGGTMNHRGRPVGSFPHSHARLS